MRAHVTLCVCRVSLPPALTEAVAFKFQRPASWLHEKANAVLPEVLTQAESEARAEKMREEARAAQGLPAPEAKPDPPRFRASAVEVGRDIGTKMASWFDPIPQWWNRLHATN